jgi:hypothetical protein
MEVNVKRAAKAKVSERAIIARINRALAPQDMQLKTSRGWRMKLDVGDYYVINVQAHAPAGHRPRGRRPDWEEVDYSERAA